MIFMTAFNACVWKSPVPKQPCTLARRYGLWPCLSLILKCRLLICPSFKVTVSQIISRTAR